MGWFNSRRKILLISFGIVMIASTVLGYYLYVLLCCSISIRYVEPGPLYPATSGEVWPKPQKEERLDISFSFVPSKFKFQITNHNCSILSKAIVRSEAYLNDLFTLSRRAAPGGRRNDSHARVALGDVWVDLSAPCEEYPYFGMNENYTLRVSQTSTLNSSSVWGTLRALETFVQLFYLSSDHKEVLVRATAIADHPRYAHRGLLVDSSRHYLAPALLRRSLDAMAANKLNVLHWHLVDDPSFPYRSDAFPELSEKGAYFPTLVYNSTVIKDVIDYARDRGIRVVPEFDVPGHTRSWGEAHPEILTQCYSDGQPKGLGPLNPIKNATYTLLKDFFAEVQQLFPDEYLHIGGDEIDLGCWSSNPEIQEYMKNHNIKYVEEMLAFFMKKTIGLLSNSSKFMVWQEVFDLNVPLSEDTLVEVWRMFWVDEMVKVLSANRRVLFSALWYLDTVYGYSFESMYRADPERMVQGRVTPAQLRLIQGGEACMWGEMVDDTNVLSRVWPRASAVAEVLWSAPQDSVDSSTWRRIEEHTCRMKRRGIPAEPARGPGFCVTLDNVV